MKLVKNSDIALTVDGNSVPIFFEPIRSQQTVLCIEGHKRSDLGGASHRFLLGYFLEKVFLLGYFLEKVAQKKNFLQKVAQKKSVRSTSKVTAFVAFNAKHSLLGPYWFEENGHTVTISYIAILDQFHGNLTQKLNQIQLRLAWFV